MKIKAFQCPICGRTFDHKLNATSHLKSHKIWPGGTFETLPLDGTNNGYFCPFCHFKASTHPKLRSHLKQHVNLKMFTCIQPDCQELFTDTQTLIRHVELNHPTPIYKCYICQESTNSLLKIGEHYSFHSPNIQLKTPEKLTCDQCKSTFSRIEHLKNHLLTETHDHKCSHCEKTFVCRRTLRRHLEIHSERLLVCPLCSKGFRNKAYLNAHRVTHKSEKPFVCEICNKCFGRKDLLTRHSYIHRSSKRFQCPLKDVVGCLKEYDRTDKLQLHIRTHTQTIKKPSVEKGHKCKTSDYKTLEVLILNLDK